MELMLDTIADLLRVADADGDGTGQHARVLELLQACEPSLVLMAEADGTLLAADSLRPEVSVDAAGPLAAKLARRLAGRRACSLEVPSDDGLRLALGVRLPDFARGVILGCVVEPSRLGGASPDELQTALTVCGAAVWTAARNNADDVKLRTRVEQLLAEHDTLRASHTEAVTSAIEEREERLREQQEHVGQLQAVMMMAADGIVTVDEKGTIESFNEAAACIFGYAPQEVIGQNLSMLMPLPHRQRHDDYLAHYLQTGQTKIVGSGQEVIGQRKDGTMFPLDLAMSEVCIGQRRIFTGIFRDITQRKKAEQELRRLHLQNEMILNSAGEGILGTDRHGNVIFANPAAARMLGWEALDLIGKPLHETIHHSRADGTPHPRAECPMHASLRGEAVSPASNQVFWRKDGTSFPLEYTCTPIREDTEIVGAVITFRDITKRRMLEAQLRQAQKLESIGQLAAGIAHEINTPTQYIGDNMRFLQGAFRDLSAVLAKCNGLWEAAGNGRAPDDTVADLVAAVRQTDVEYLMEEIPKAIHQSLEGVQRVAKIVRSMKEFSHPGGESWQAVDLNQAVESTLTVSRNEWKYVADAVTDFDANLPLVTCLPGDVNQVILNLIVNAAHAIADKVRSGAVQKGTITVRTRHDGDWVEICVEDTGTGIPKQIQSRIYDPFFTTKAVGRGTGQGLAIAHSIVVEKHRGTIAFQSEVGQGTTFVVRLPARQEPPSSGRGAPSEKANPVR